MAHGTILCDTPEWTGCEQRAAVAWTCQVEGREVTLCRSCDRLWKDHARRDPRLFARCPNCAKSVPASATEPPKLGMSDLLGTYLSVAIDRAMHRAGILKPSRDAVLKILDTDMSVWEEAEAQKTRIESLSAQVSNAVG